MVKKSLSQTPAVPVGAQTLRIIGGEYRSRRLPFPALAGLRPTGDRVRETVFNWLMHDIVGAHCLDLFAGSGALGLEALSRGAAHCTFVESQTMAFNAITQHCHTLGVGTRAHCVASEALVYLAKKSKQYDVVFVDPPFAAGYYEAVLEAITPHLNPHHLVYIEYPAETPPRLPNGWQNYKQGKAGTVGFGLWRYEKTN